MSNESSLVLSKGELFSEYARRISVPVVKPGSAIGARPACNCDGPENKALLEWVLLGRRGAERVEEGLRAGRGGGAGTPADTDFRRGGGGGGIRFTGASDDADEDKSTTGAVVNLGAELGIIVPRLCGSGAGDKESLSESDGVRSARASKNELPLLSCTGLLWWSPKGCQPFSSMLSSSCPCS